MRLKRRWMLATGFVCAVTAASALFPPFVAESGGQDKRTPGKSDGPPVPSTATEAERSLQKTMLKEASKAFEQSVQQYKTSGGFCVEEIYRWSCRWLEAEWDLANDAAGRSAALKAHLERMADLAKNAEASAKVGVGRDVDAASARYFRAQAELWVTRGSK